MSAKKQIKTTGDLREVLAETINAVKDGSMAIEQANSMHKLAKNISDSLYSETKIRMFSTEIGETVHKMGSMPLNGK